MPRLPRQDTFGPALICACTTPYSPTWFLARTIIPLQASAATSTTNQRVTEVSCMRSSLILVRGTGWLDALHQPFTRIHFAGLANDVALAQLVSEGASDAYDYVIHAGDVRSTNNLLFCTRCSSLYAHAVCVQSGRQQ
jgi:hypothetical protein